MLAACSLGILSVRKMQTRLCTLRDMRDALILCEGELARKQPPLPELIQTVSDYADGQASVFFHELSNALAQLGEKSFFVI